MHGLYTIFAIALALIPIAGRGGDNDWKQLFNGKDLSGWEHIGPGKFVIEDSLLKTEGGMGLLWYSKEKIGNAVLRVVYKVKTNDANSGVFIRIPEKPADPWMAVNQGYEVQIDNGFRHLYDDYHVTGVLYSLTKAMAYPQKRPGKWNTLEITLSRLCTIIHVNGKIVTNYCEGQPVPPEKRWFEPERGPRPEYGYIGLQNHDEQSTVYFKEVAVRRLDR